MALAANQIIAKLREKNKRQIDIARKLNEKWLSSVNNTIHRRCTGGIKTEKIRSVVAQELELPYETVWGDNGN